MSDKLMTEEEYDAAREELRKKIDLYEAQSSNRRSQPEARHAAWIRKSIAQDKLLALTINRTRGLV